VVVRPCPYKPILCRAGGEDYCKVPRQRNKTCGLDVYRRMFSREVRESEEFKELIKRFKKFGSGFTSIESIIEEGFKQKDFGFRNQLDLGFVERLPEFGFTPYKEGDDFFVSASELNAPCALRLFTNRYFDVIKQEVPGFFFRDNAGRDLSFLARMGDYWHAFALQDHGLNNFIENVFGVSRRVFCENSYVVEVKVPWVEEVIKVRVTPDCVVPFRVGLNEWRINVIDLKSYVKGFYAPSHYVKQGMLYARVFEQIPVVSKVFLHFLSYRKRSGNGFGFDPLYRNEKQKRKHEDRLDSMLLEVFHWLPRFKEDPESLLNYRRSVLSSKCKTWRQHRNKCRDAERCDQHLEQVIEVIKERGV